MILAFYLVASDFTRLFPLQLHVLQRENPAAAVAPANWVLGCPKVLRHQRRFPLLFLDCCSELRMVLILAVWSVTIGVFFLST